MDATSLDRPVERTADSLRTDLAGLRIGLVREFDTKALGRSSDALYREAYRDLERLGAELVEVSLPTADYGLATYYLIAPAECSSNLARFDGVRYGLRVESDDVRAMYDETRAAGFGPEVKRRILIGTYALSSGYYDAYYVRAQKARTLIARDFERAFAQCDLIACPAASCPAFEFNAKSDPYSMYLMDYYTIPMSLAGLPALSVPCGWTTPDGANLPCRSACSSARRFSVKSCCWAPRPRTKGRRISRSPMLRRPGRCAHDSRVRSRYRHRVSRRAQDDDEDVLRLPQRVRRRAEHQDVSGLSRHARCVAGAQRQSDRANRPNRSGVRRGDSRLFEVRSQELLLSRHAQGLPDLAVRHAADRRRLRKVLAGRRHDEAVPSDADSSGGGHREIHACRFR